MPGAITDPTKNGKQSWIDYTHANPDDNSYDLYAGKGWTWNGTSWNAPAGGAGGNQNDPLKAGYSAPSLFTGGNAGLQGPGGASMGGGGGPFSLGGKSSYSGMNPFATDAAAAKLKGEYDRLRKQTQGRVNEDLMSRGIFSSGVGANIMGQEMGQLDLGEAAGLEDLYNKSSQQQLAFQLEQQRMENEMRRSMYGGGSQRFGNANENQQAGQAYGYSSKTGGQFGTTSDGGYPTSGGSSSSGGGPLPTKAGGEPVRGAGESADDFFHRWQKWKATMNQAAASGQGGSEYMDSAIGADQSF